MKASKILSVIFIVIALSMVGVAIFSNKEVRVNTQKITKERYSPYISVSGSIIEAQDGSMIAVVYVGESNISDITEGQLAEITGSGFKGKKYNASVMYVADTAKKVNVGENKVVAVEVMLKINDADYALKPGFTANVKIYTDKENEAIVVPYSAVVQQQDKEYVYVYENGMAYKTYIQTGKELINGYEILKGIDGESVVVINPLILKEDEVMVAIDTEE